MMMIVTSNNFTNEEIDKMDEMMNEKVEKRLTTLLFQTVCKFGDSQKVRQFIEDNKTLNAPEARLSQLDFNYGLCIACINGNNQLIDLMLAHGATTLDFLPIPYREYKQEQVLKSTKLHDSLVDFVLSK